MPLCFCGVGGENETLEQTILTSKANVEEVPPPNSHPEDTSCMRTSMLQPYTFLTLTPSHPNMNPNPYLVLCPDSKPCTYLPLPQSTLNLTLSPSLTPSLALTALTQALAEALTLLNQPELQPRLSTPPSPLTLPRIITCRIESQSSPLPYLPPSS